MITGAVLNLILDPVFIFPLGMGVVGAGIATVIGQVAAGVLFLAYLPRLHTVRLRRQALRPTIRLTGRILGSQPADPDPHCPGTDHPEQPAAGSRSGQRVRQRHRPLCLRNDDEGLSDCPLHVCGRLLRRTAYQRLQLRGEAFSSGAADLPHGRPIALVISGVWFLVFQLFPRQIGMLFVSDSPLYLDCAQHCFRLYMAAFFLYGLHLATASFFQGIGRPVPSLAIPLARQGVFLIPLAILLSGRFGLDGALLAAPISDVLTFLLSLLLVRREFAVWRQRDWIET